MKFLTEREFHLCRLKHVDLMPNYKTTEKDTGKIVWDGIDSKSCTGHRTVDSAKRCSGTECTAVASTTRVTASYQVNLRLLPACPTL